MFVRPDVVVTGSAVKFTAPSNVNALVDGHGETIDFQNNGAEKLQAILGAGFSLGGFSLIDQKTIEGLSKVSDKEYRVNNFALFIAFINAVAAEAQAQMRLARAA